MPVPVPSRSHPLPPAPIVVATDDFGREVGRALAALAVRVVLLDVEDVPALTGSASAASTPVAPVVLASLRPEPLLRDRLGDWAYAQRRPFLPVEVDQPQLVVGPWVVAGASACDRCYRRRLGQHDPAGVTTRALRAAYAADPGLRPSGWLPATAALAAAVVALTFRGQPGGLAPGAVRTLNTVNLVPSFGAVTGFTGCRVCDDGDPATRSWAELSVAVRELVGAGQ